jgi:hypothetical protein
VMLTNTTPLHAGLCVFDGCRPSTVVADSMEAVGLQSEASVDVARLRSISREDGVDRPDQTDTWVP